MPKRIQRRRTKGWRMPANTVYVGRPTRFGNPYSGPGAVELFRDAMVESPDLWSRVEVELRGKDLCCWCQAGRPCHADVLLEIANALH